MASLDGILNQIISQSLAEKAREKQRARQKRAQDKQRAAEFMLNTLSSSFESYQQGTSDFSELMDSINTVQEEASSLYGPKTQQALGHYLDNLMTEAKGIRATKRRLGELNERVASIKRKARRNKEVDYEEVKGALDNLRSKVAKMGQGAQKRAISSLQSASQVINNRQISDFIKERLDKIAKVAPKNSIIQKYKGKVDDLYSKDQYGQIAKLYDDKLLNTLMRKANVYTERAKGGINELEADIMQSEESAADTADSKFSEYGMEKMIQKERKNILKGYREGYSTFDKGVQKSISKKLEGLQEKGDVKDSVKDIEDAVEAYESVSSVITHPNALIRSSQDKLKENVYDATSRFYNASKSIANKIIESDIPGFLQSDAITKQEKVRLLNHIRNDIQVDKLGKKEQQNKLTELVDKYMVGEGKNKFSREELRNRLKQSQSSGQMQQSLQALNAARKFVGRSDLDTFKGAKGNVKEDLLLDATNRMIRMGRSLDRFARRTDTEQAVSAQDINFGEMLSDEDLYDGRSEQISSTQGQPTGFTSADKTRTTFPKTITEKGLYSSFDKPPVNTSKSKPFQYNMKVAESLDTLQKEWEERTYNPSNLINQSPEEKEDRFFSLSNPFKTNEDY